MTSTESFRTAEEVAKERGIIVEVEKQEEKPKRKTKKSRDESEEETGKKAEAKVQRVPFGVEKLDDALEGGTSRGSWVVIGGEPGTGKTILAIHFAWRGLEDCDKIIYVTTEQEFYDVVTQAKQFGIDFEQHRILNLAELIQWDKKDKEWTFEKPNETPDIVVIDLFGLSRVAKLALQEEVEEQKEGKKKTTKKLYAPWSIDTLIYALDKAYEVLDVEKGQQVRLIIDSMSTFWVDKPAMARKYSYQLKLAYHRNNITAFLTCQYAMTTKGIFGFGAEHIADVVMETWISDAKNSRKLERYLAIKKTRTTAIKHNLFKIDFAKESDKSRLILEPVQ